MEVTDQLHAPAALPQGKGTQYSSDRRVSGVPNSGWTVWRRKKTLPSLGIPTPDRPARSLDTEAECEIKIRSSDPERGKIFNRHNLYT
jgi:hypothetical protein